MFMPPATEATQIRQTGAHAIGGEIGQSGLDPLHISGSEDGLRFQVLC